jgi:hypothetical protein
MLCLEQDLGYDSSIVNKMIKKRKLDKLKTYKHLPIGTCLRMEKRQFHLGPLRLRRG